MKKTWVTIDELALELQVSVKSIRRAYRKGEIPVERIGRFVRFDLERVKAAMQGNGQGQTPFHPQEQGLRSATGGASGRRAQRPSPRLGKTGASIAQTPRRKK
ncbi:MAG: helix-turn-helix domain-containing protein [Nitrospira sp. CR2.1]|nr:helix-turn-helix domain-containing protein [Nitrospira sp. CR2.1]MBA5873198.1 helix-turn-helix domain-containing protein [Nitrospira sp. CR1.2]